MYEFASAGICGVRSSSPIRSGRSRISGEESSIDHDVYRNMYRNMYRWFLLHPIVIEVRYFVIK